MTDMAQGHPPAAATKGERRSLRTEVWLPAPIKQRALAVATLYDTSLAEVVIHCVEFGLSDEFVLSFIARAADRRREAGMGKSPIQDEVPTQLRIPSSLKDRLKASGLQHRIEEKHVVLRCLLFGLFDELVLQQIERSVEGAKKRGRTRGQSATREDDNRAA
ncbi:MAG TPA: hypothetical protein VGF45_10325 [Polyangia bacterium]